MHFRNGWGCRNPASQSPQTPAALHASPVNVLIVTRGTINVCGKLFVRNHCRLSAAVSPGKPLPLLRGLQVLQVIKRINNAFITLFHLKYE